MKRLIIFVFPFLIPALLHGQKAAEQLYSGNTFYAKGLYSEAEKAYQQAYSEKKNREAQYNLGNAQYQQKNFDKAAGNFSEVARNSKDPRLKAMANHNIGNTYLEQKKWDEAIQYYKQSLRENPQSPETKYNLAYAQAMKKKEQGGGKDNKDQNKDQQNKDQQNKDQENKDQDKDQNKDQQKPEDQNKPEQPGAQPDKPQLQPSKLSKEQADRILNALNQEEKKLKEKKEKGKGVPVKLDKDW